MRAWRGASKGAVPGITIGLLVAAMSATTWVAPAQAREPTRAEVAEAQRRFQEATELYEQDNNLAGALAEFRRAYALAPNFKVLYNIGQLCYLLQDYPCALTSFSRYLREGGAEVPGPRRDEVQRDVARLQSRVAKLRIVTSKVGAEVVVDNVRVGKTPLDAPVLVGAGRPQVRVTLPGHLPFTRVVEVASMETATVDVELLPFDGSEGALSQRRQLDGAAGPGEGGGVRAAASRPTPRLPWVITGVLAVGAGTTGVLALWSAADLKKGRDQFGVQDSDLASKSNRTKRLALATDILLGATAVSAAVATYMTFAEPSRSEDIALVVGPTSIGLAGGF
jgi:hypothetical protein